MTRRTTVALALTLAAIAAVLVVRAGRTAPPPRHPTIAAAPHAPIAPRLGARGPRTTDAAAPIDPPALEPVEHRDAVAFADDYAAAVCACRDAACVDDTRDEFAARLGEALPTRDTAALAASLARADACADAWRAAAVADDRADQPSTIRTSPGNAAGS